MNCWKKNLISLFPLSTEERCNIRALKYFFKAYVVDQNIRKIIEAKDFHELQTNPTLSISQFKEVKRTMGITSLYLGVTSLN